jgi:hypothetical protein
MRINYNFEPQGQDCQQYRQRNLLFLPIAVTCKCQKDRASGKPRNTTSDINPLILLILVITSSLAAIQQGRYRRTSPAKMKVSSMD